LINNIQSLIQLQNIEDEINSIKKDFTFTHKNERFKEIFKTYDLNIEYNITRIQTDKSSLNIFSINNKI
jgi:hypothetical protein